MKKFMLLIALVLATLAILAHADEPETAPAAASDPSADVKVDEPEPPLKKTRKSKKDEPSDTEEDSEEDEDGYSGTSDESSGEDDEDHEDFDVQSDHENQKNVGDAEPGQDWGEDERAYVVHPNDYDAETARLKAQFLWWDSHEKPALEKAGIKDGMHVVDVGCGPGILAEKILEWLPESKVTCVDVDPLFVELTKTRLAPLVESGRLIPQVSDAENMTALESDKYDFVVLRFVLQHLDKPEAAVKEAFRILKPNADARVVVEDIDDSFADVMDPDIPELDDLQDRLEHYRRTATHKSDPTIGRRVPKLLTQAGFESLGVDMLVLHSDIHGKTDMAPLYHPDQYQQLVRVNRLSEKRIKAAGEALSKFVADPSSTLASYALVISGKKVDNPKPAGKEEL